MESALIQTVMLGQGGLGVTCPSALESAITMWLAMDPSPPMT